MSKPLVSCDWQGQLVRIHLTHVSQTTVNIFEEVGVYRFFGINLKCNGITTTLFLNPDQFNDLYAALHNHILKNMENNND